MNIPRIWPLKCWRRRSESNSIPIKHGKSVSRYSKWVGNRPDVEYYPVRNRSAQSMDDGGGTRSVHSIGKPSEKFETSFVISLSYGSPSRVARPRSQFPRDRGTLVPSRAGGRLHSAGSVRAYLQLCLRFGSRALCYLRSLSPGRTVRRNSQRRDLSRLGGHRHGVASGTGRPGRRGSRASHPEFRSRRTWELADFS